MKYAKIDLNWKCLIENAIEYIEKNLTQELCFSSIAKEAYASEYHFHRMFSFLTGVTLGEYIRNRRLYFAALDILNGEKIFDVAIKYCYESPDSFSKTFKAFHGILPSEVKHNQSILRKYPILILPELQKTQSNLFFKVIEMDSFRFVGYKTDFVGSPYGKEREEQERKFLSTTRAKQWLLRGAASNIETEFYILSNITDFGYEYSVAYELDNYDIHDLFDPTVSGVQCINSFGYEIIDIPKSYYAVFETQKQLKPINAYVELRKKIMENNLLNHNYKLKDAPEIVKIHWRPLKGKRHRYIEICMPIERIEIRE